MYMRIHTCICTRPSPLNLLLVCFVCVAAVVYGSQPVPQHAAVFLSGIPCITTLMHTCIFVHKHACIRAATPVAKKRVTPAATLDAGLSVDPSAAVPRHPLRKTSDAGSDAFCRPFCGCLGSRAATPVAKTSGAGSDAFRRPVRCRLFPLLASSIGPIS